MSMKKIPLILLPIILILCALSFAQGEDMPDFMFTDKDLTHSVDIHYTGKYCTECHGEKPLKGGDINLKFSEDFNQLCRCHGYTSSSYIHPVDIEPSEEKKAKIPEKLPLKDNMLRCTTCHDIYKQCQLDPGAKKSNPFFLRGAPYARRTDLCFKCHDETKYQKLDPHNQIDERGNIIDVKCLYCHEEKPDVQRATFKKVKGTHGTVVKLIGNLEVLCYRCHFKQQTLHPINANHLRKPSEKTLGIMRQSEKNLGVILPLNYEGKITCATCHNPHERGVIPAEKASAEGASEKFRLRLPGLTGEICTACHKDKSGTKSENTKNRFN
jgi:hypothetical protein